MVITSRDDKCCSCLRVNGPKVKNVNESGEMAVAFSSHLPLIKIYEQFVSSLHLPILYCFIVSQTSPWYAISIAMASQDIKIISHPYHMGEPIPVSDTITTLPSSRRAFALLHDMHRTVRHNPWVVQWYHGGTDDKFRLSFKELYVSWQSLHVNPFGIILILTSLQRVFESKWLARHRHRRCQHYAAMQSAMKATDESSILRAILRLVLPGLR